MPQTNRKKSDKYTISVQNTCSVEAAKLNPDSILADSSRTETPSNRSVVSANFRTDSGSSETRNIELFREKIIREIESSAIDPDFWAVGAIQTVSDTEVLPGGEVAYPIHEALNWRLVRFGAQARENLDALLFQNENRSTWQAKLSRSLEAGKKSYLAPTGNGSRAYLPPIPLKIYRRIAKRNGFNLEDLWFAALTNQRISIESIQTQLFPSLRSKSPQLSIDSGNQGGQSSSTGKTSIATPNRSQNGFGSATRITDSSLTSPALRKALRCWLETLSAETIVPDFWDWVAANEIPIILTEGGKKALSLLSSGYLAIALYGVNSGVLKYDRIAGEKIRKLKPELIPDLKRFAVPGRKFILAFDQDASFEIRSKVAAAIGSLGSILVAAGCEVSIATWNGKDGKGIDDLIASRGIEAWEKSLSESVSFAQWLIGRQLAREVRRQPDLNIGDQEFIEVASELPKTGIVALHGGKATGKSKAIGELIRDRTSLSITSLISLGRGQAETWGGVFANDSDRHGSKLLKDGSPVNGGSVCVPSLLKVSAVEAEILILDELTATLEFLLGSNLANRNGIRSLLLSEFSDRVRRAKQVLIADADLTEEAIGFIETIRGERTYLVKSERKALTYQAEVIDGSKNAAIALLQQRIEASDGSKLIYLNCDSKALAESLTELLGRDQTLLITSDTSGGEIESRFLQSKGREIPWLISQRIKFIVSSPSVVQGFSIEKNTDLIDSVWGFYSGCSISAHSIAQAPDRVRDSSVPRFFWIAKKGSATSKLSKAQSIATFLKEFKLLKSTAARLTAHSLSPEARIDSESIDWQSENLKQLAAIEVRRNRGISALRETVIALLRKEGKQISVVNPELSKKRIEAAGQSLKRATAAVSDRYCAAIESAIDLTQEQADQLDRKSDRLTSEESLALEKFRIRSFYRLETVSTAEIKFDRKGATRKKIKNLEAILSSEAATDRTARSIERSPTTPQDWNSIAVSCWLLEQSGAAGLIRSIAAGEIEALTFELVEPIAEFVRSHSTEFKIANFRDVRGLANQQIVGEILTRHGIKTRRRGNRNNLRYEVCKPELEAILAIIKRRQKEIAPVEKTEVNQTGAIPRKPSKIGETKPTEADLKDIRDLWNQADSPEAKEAIKKLFPIELLKRALNKFA